MKSLHHRQEQSQLQDGGENQHIGDPHQKLQGRDDHVAREGREAIEETHAAAQRVDQWRADPDESGRCAVKSNRQAEHRPAATEPGGRAPWCAPESERRRRQSAAPRRRKAEIPTQTATPGGSREGSAPRRQWHSAGNDRGRECAPQGKARSSAWHAAWARAAPPGRRKPPGNPAR